MAFMMPVVKNDYQIYKSNRNRRISECANPQTCHSKKVLECSKSEGPSLSTSPGSDFVLGSPAHRSIPLSISSRHAHHSSHFSHNNPSKNSSRTSQSSLPSPCKSNSPSPPKSNSSSSLSLFHNKLVDKLKKSLKSKDPVPNGNNSVLSPKEMARKRS